MITDLLFWCFKTLTWNLIYKMFDKPHCLKFSFECSVNVCWYFWWIDSFPTLKFLNLHMFYGDGEVVVIFHLCYAIHVNFIVFYFGFTRSKINQECFIILWRHKCPCYFADVVYIVHFNGILNRCGDRHSFHVKRDETTHSWICDKCVGETKSMTTAVNSYKKLYWINPINLIIFIFRILTYMIICFITSKHPPSNIYGEGKVV